MSMLRSSKFVKNLFSFARNIAIAHPRGVEASLVQRSLALVSSDRAYATQRASKNLTQVIDRSIQKLDQDVRRSGRISKKELEQVFNEIRLMKHATSTQSLMLIRCCGHLVPDERPEVRTQLVNEIWDTFEKLGVPYDVSHYNALLRVYLENDHQFSPSEFLAKLEQKGIEPNRVTFQRLIAVYCQKGDIDGAKSILEFMKEKQMPVNESVFNSLIVGHSQCNDMESAVGILSVMKQANLQPSSETYTALLCGYAKHGDIESILKTINDCKTNEIDLFGRDLLEIIYTLAINNHSELAQPILSLLSEMSGFNHDAKNTILRLVSKGEDKAALEVLKVMPKLSSAEGESIPTGNFLIKQIVAVQRPAETILELCSELKRLGNQNALLNAVEASLQIDNPERSLKLLAALAKEDSVLFHYYWPVLVQYGKAKNLNGVLLTLSQMAQDVGQPPSGETLRDYVIPYFDKNLIGEQGIHTMRQGGVSIASAASAMVGYLLSLNQIKEAKKVALLFRANYSSVPQRKMLVSAFMATKDVPSLVTLVRLMEETDSEDVEPGGRVLLDVVHFLGRERSQILPSILNKYLELGIGISSEVAELIQNKLSGDELTQEISTLLTKLTSSELALSELKRPAARRLKLEQDESTLLNLIKTGEAKGTNTNGLKKQLLVTLCRNRELEKAVKLRDDLIAEGFEITRNVNTELFELFVHHEKLDEALKVFKQLDSNDPDFVLDASKPVKIAMLLYKIDKFDDALSFLKEHSQPEAKEGFLLVSSIWKFLNLLAEKGDVEKLQILFNTLIECNYVSPSNIILGPLIKVHLLKDDVESALKAFEECCIKYRATPWKNELACKLIEKEDSSNLQKLTDLSTQIHGEVNSLYDLVLSFVECGRIRQARKILETPGLRTRTQRLNSACERYTSEGHINYLESLVEVTKDLNHINRADIYQHLLSSYDKNDQVDKALGLWTQMQDEDVQPSEKFLIKLGNLLKRHDRSVPFDIPEVVKAAEKDVQKPQKTPNVPKTSSYVLKSFRTAINAKELDEALEIYNNKLSSDPEFTMNDRSRLLTLMINSGRVGEASKLALKWFEAGEKTNVRTISFLVNNLAKIGDIDAIDSIGKHIDDDVKKMVSFINRRTHCMVEAGRAAEVLKDLKAQIDCAKTQDEIDAVNSQFPRGGIYSILNNMPDLVPEFEELAQAYHQKGILAPMNVLWVYNTVNNNKDKAEKAWEMMKNVDRLMFQPILGAARSNSDLNLIDDLLERLHKHRPESQSLAIAYSCKMDILIKVSDVQGCEKVLEEALKVCTLKEINRSVLSRLKNLVELSGRKFNYTIPERTRNDQSSSSSSSSDSDDEDTKVTSKSH